MKYDITYSCGHTGTVELYGKTSERESKIRWYETTAVCPEWSLPTRERGLK